MPSLYVHIPFCEKKCFYCSFVVAVGQSERSDAYLQAMARESQQYRHLRFSSIYIGGGTPSYLTDDQLQRLLGLVRENCTVTVGGEYTLEMNPESVQETKLRLMRKMGVNRISLGVQSLNDRYLRYLGRNHNRLKAYSAYQMIRDAGFTNVNCDLMFGFPQQTLGEIEEEVGQLTAFSSEHISLYMLTLEEHSRFYAQKIQLPDSDEQVHQYERVVRQLERARCYQYEISNFAKPGKESQHNLNYWRGGEYIGLGVGAHSYWQGRLFYNVSRLNTYMARVSRDGSAVEAGQSLDAHERLKQAFLIGLRMNQGVALEALEKAWDCSLASDEQKKITYFIQHDFLMRDDGYLKTTPKGRLVLDELCAQLS